MKQFSNLIILILLFLGCATQDQKSSKPTSQDEALYKAIKSGNLTSIKEQVGDQDLTGLSGLHNLLVQNSCNRIVKDTNVDVAQYLIEKGAKPTEEEIPNPELAGTEYSTSHIMKGPLSSTLNGPDCGPLLQFYLDHMTSEDIAKASMNFKATTFSDILSWGRQYPEQQVLWEGQHIANAPKTYQNLELIKNKNEALCKTGKTINCTARDHIQSEIASYHKGVQDLANHRACESYGLMAQHRQLMQEQVEFGKQTGVASPKTYDSHSQAALTEQDIINSYNQIIYLETGKPFDPKKCSN